MTKQDFIALAAALRDIRPHIESPDAFYKLYESIRDVCKNSSPNFAPDIFCDAVYSSIVPAPKPRKPARLVKPDWL